MKAEGVDLKVRLKPGYHANGVLRARQHKGTTHRVEVWPHLLPEILTMFPGIKAGSRAILLLRM